MTDHDQTQPAREADAPESAKVIPFPTRSERWHRQWTRPMPDPEGPDAA